MLGASTKLTRYTKNRDFTFFLLNLFEGFVIKKL